jgi:hypothetical protein
MEAANTTSYSSRRLLFGSIAAYVAFALVSYAVDPRLDPTASKKAAEIAEKKAAREKLLPHGDGTQDNKNPQYSTDPTDPFPMPAELIDVKLMEQTYEQKMAKSGGCIVCHLGSHDPHYKETVRLGCTDCHGGDATAPTKELAHPKARYPQFWAGSANPVRSYTLLNHESPEYIRFVNPGDFRVAHISCGTSGCHPKEVQTNRKQIMTTGCMLWGAALYNNGAVPFKKARFGEAYSMNGAPLRLNTWPPPSEEEMATKGVLPFLDPLPRYENSQPGNILRIFEPGGRFKIETGIPELKEEPGRPRTRLSERGIGTQNRTDPVFIGLSKTRLFDPTLNFMGTNDNPGDFRNSGCTACHVIYANDRSPTHSGPFAQFGNRGYTAPDNPDPTIPKNEPGHPIAHRFTNAIPTSQCMVCHVHPGTTVMNSYIGYMWWDEDSEAELIYPNKQKNPSPEDMIRIMMRNPNESATRSNLASAEFTTEMAQLNAQTTKAQFGDFHSHGWAFKAVYKKDRKGVYRDYFGNDIGSPTPQKFLAATAFAQKMRDFHKTKHDTAQKSMTAETEFNQQCRAGSAVHLMDIHMEKGMHCVDCHFSQDGHGNNRLHQEVRAATEIACIDCHGTPSDYTTLRTSGPASYTSDPDGLGRDMKSMRTPYGKPRFEIEDGPGGIRRYFQNSSVEKGVRWEMVQTKDTINKKHPRYNEKSALAKTVRVEGGQMVWGEVPEGGTKDCAHGNSNMSCIACHSSWNPSCFGCHLPQRANMKMPNLHADGNVTRNYTSYCFQTLRDDVYMLARDGDATGNKVNPSRSSCAIHVGSYNGNRESIYYQQQTISADGYGGTAFSTNVPHTVRGKGWRETKQCTDCHVSKNNDNNAIMAQLLMHGTQYVNHMTKWVWAATGAEGLFGIQATEQTEPQAVFGSDLHRAAYPENYAKLVENGNVIKSAHEHPGRDVKEGIFKPFREHEVLQVQARGEYLYAACGEHGVRIYDIAFIDNKAFAERITSAPVSPTGQKFYVHTKNARYITAPTTVAVDPTRKMNPANKEQPVHLVFGFLYVADAEEGLILIGAGTTIDGNPINNYLKRAVTFNPDELLKGASYVHIVGHYAYVCCDAGLVVVDLDNPLEPKVSHVIGGEHLKKPRAVQTQFRYAYVVDEEGVKILEINDIARPVLKAQFKLPDCHNLYLARTYAYIAAGKRGMVILDITNPEQPCDAFAFNAGGAMNDVRDIKLGATYNSVFAYVADGKNGMRIVQLVSPQTPGFEGFSPRPTPKLIATYKVPHGGKVLAIGKGLDRDRAVDESGHQIGVFGRLGARPFNATEQKKMYLRDGELWTVSDDPKDPVYVERRAPPTPKPAQ